MKLCENYFIELAKDNPLELKEYILGSKQDQLSEGLRARAIESCSQIPNKELAKEILFKCLEMKYPICQEAAIYALEKHLDQEVYQKLQDFSKTNLSKGLKEAVTDAIQLFEEIEWLSQWDDDVW